MKHFGFRRIREDTVLDNAALNKIYGETVKKVKVGFLTTGNGVGFELFEFIDPPARKADDIKKDWTLEDQYRHGGVFHIGVTVAAPDAVAEQACADGAMRVGETLTMMDGEKALYIRDPWGLVLELLTCNFETLLANR